jgi:DNA-binding transcriptional MerR regulator
MRKVLQDFKRNEFHLEELVSVAAQMIERAAGESVDGRVAPVPDARTVRYYQTTGILQKPLRYDGRNAIYGYHHLLQLIAIKLLQQQGLSLAQVQTALVQASWSELERSLEETFEDQGGEEVTQENQDAISIAGLSRSPQRAQEKLHRGDTKLQNSWDASNQHRSTRIGGRSLIAVEVAPGISVQIDQDRVQNPMGVIEKIIALLNAKNGDIE